MKWYIVVKTIKGHRYRYRQRTWREGDQVRTESQYLGPAEGGRRRAVNTTNKVHVARRRAVASDNSPAALSSLESLKDRACRAEAEPGKVGDLQRPLNPYIARLTMRRGRENGPSSKVPRRRKKRPIGQRIRVPKSLPEDSDFSNSFWDTPRSATRLGQQAKLYHLAQLKLKARYARRSALKTLVSPAARAEHARIGELEEVKAWYQRKAASAFDRTLTYTKRGIRLRRE